MNKQVPKNKVITWLFNPFHYLAGGKALVIGLIIIAISGVIAWFSNSHFDGVLDFHTGRQAPIWFIVAEGFVDWLSLALVLLIAGIIISRTRFRVIDIFGTQALARFPTIFMALIALLPGYNTLINKIIANPMNAATIIFENIGALIILMLVGIVILIMLVWMVALMYRAFAVSFNVSGGKAIVSFIIGLIIAEVLSKIAIILAIKSISA
ncbi:MAG: hypothetical protein QME64_07855 [bacterium]|nr:hypothetical protein [bacterium]